MHCLLPRNFARRSFRSLFLSWSAVHWVAESGCTVYKDRPEVCSAFKCAWLADDYLPMWFQPHLSNLICTWNKWGDDSNEVRTYLKVHTTEVSRLILNIYDG